MACTCTNRDGTLSLLCYGSCLKSAQVQQDENAKRDPMKGFAELILSQVEDRIKNNMNLLRIEIEQEKLELFKEAFIEGIKAGIAINREFD